MIEHWQSTLVQGLDDQDIGHVEEVLHRRGEDPMVMAFRRNNALAACNRVTMVTLEAFTQIREQEAQKRRADIPRDDRQSEEFEW